MVLQINSLKASSYHSHQCTQIIVSKSIKSYLSVYVGTIIKCNFFCSKSLILTRSSSYEQVQCNSVAFKHNKMALPRSLSLFFTTENVPTAAVLLAIFILVEGKASRNSFSDYLEKTFHARLSFTFVAKRVLKYIHELKYM